MATVAVTGMRAEARIARQAGLAAIVIGGSAAQRLTAVERAIAEGATRLISFGIAGGLDPTLTPGMVLVPATVRDDDGTIFACDVARLLGAGSILGAAAMVIDPAAKRWLFKTTGAAAVDLESGAVAQAAARAGIPFHVIRAVADPARRGLPPAARIGLDGRGRVALWPVLRSVATEPKQIPALIRLAADTNLALWALRRAARRISATNHPITES